MKSKYINFNPDTATWYLAQVNVCVVIDSDTRIIQPYGAGVKGWSVVSTTYNLSINATTARAIAPYILHTRQEQHQDRYRFDFDKLEKKKAKQ